MKNVNYVITNDQAYIKIMNTIKILPQIRDLSTTITFGFFQLS